MNRPGIDRVIILEEDLEIAIDFFEYFLATAPLLDSESFEDYDSSFSHDHQQHHHLHKHREQSSSSLLAVSAWNDNGFEGHVKRKEFIFRSDFFPGLGWMLNKQLWQEVCILDISFFSIHLSPFISFSLSFFTTIILQLSSKWPKAYWDDWLREESQRKGRHILHPEISRTFHFGKKVRER